MRKLFFAAIATLTVAVGTLAFASSASAAPSNGALSQTNLPQVTLWGPDYAGDVCGCGG
jgi:hypothetical protein